MRLFFLLMSMSLIGLSSPGGVECRSPLVIRPQGLTSLWLPHFGAQQGWTEDRHLRLAGDVNGDQRADIVGFGEEGVSVALSTGTAFDPASRWNSEFSAKNGWRVATHTRLLGDVNGDRKQDIIGAAQDGVSVALSTGTSFSPAKRWTALHHTGDVSNEKRPHYAVADVNGDSLGDLIMMNAEGVSVALSTGLKFSSFLQWTTEFHARGYVGYEGAEPLPPVIGDVNGDGLADIVGFTAEKVFVALSQGSRFQPAQHWPINWTVLRDDYHVGFASDIQHFLRDVNGDSRADILQVRGGSASFLLSLDSEFSSTQEFVPWPEREEYRPKEEDYPVAWQDANADGLLDLIAFAPVGVVVIAIINPCTIVRGDGRPDPPGLHLCPPYPDVP